VMYDAKFERPHALLDGREKAIWKETQHKP
jgi:hypothetical protein